MAMDGEPVDLESRQILSRMTSSDSVRAQVISGSASNRAGYISGCVLGGVGLLTIIVLLIHLVRQYQKTTHGPLITPMYPTSPVSAYPSQTVDQRNHVLHSSSPSLSTPSLTPQRMDSLDNLRRFSTHKPPVVSNPTIIFTDLGNLPAQGVPLMAIPSPALPSLPVQSYGSIYRPPVPPWTGSRAANPNQAVRARFLSRSSTRITSFLPRYQRSYAPSCPEDIPPAYHG